MNLWLKNKTMARKIFISILGTGYYYPTKYYFNNEISGNELECRFIQQATINHFCTNWNDDDKIYFFLTKDARKISWNNPAQKNNKNNKESYTGLSQIIKQLNLKPEILDIPNGNNEQEIWEIFQIIFNKLNNNDEVYFDITHAFRSLPMLVMVLINYAKFLKNIEVKSITYGNHQAEKDGYSPVINLTAFSELQDWTNGINEFVKNGISYQLTDLIRKKSTNKKGREKQNLQKFAIELNNFILLFSSVRGRQIYEGNNFKELEKQIKIIKQNTTIKVLEPIIKELENKISNFSNYFNMKNGEIAINWCIEHNLIQQAYTLGQEHIISILCDKFNLEYKERIDREIISKTIGIINEERKLKKTIDEKDLDKTLLDNLAKYYKIKKESLINEISQDFGELSRFRNSINHGGMVDDFQGKDFKKNFEKFYNKITEILNKCS